MITCLQYPDQWALGITTLLFKDGDEEDPNNYRAITVADAISKIYAFMLNERVERSIYLSLPLPLSLPFPLSPLYTQGS